VKAIFVFEGAVKQVVEEIEAGCKMLAVELKKKRY
jgi:hypothetical protein